MEGGMEEESGGGRKSKRGEWREIEVGRKGEVRGRGKGEEERCKGVRGSRERLRESTVGLEEG